MEKFIPFEKLSKKKQKELNNKRRNTWGDLNPVTRKPANPKAYVRQKSRKWKDDSYFNRDFIFCSKKASEDLSPKALHLFISLQYHYSTYYITHKVFFGLTFYFCRIFSTLSKAEACTFFDHVVP